MRRSAPTLDFARNIWKDWNAEIEAAVCRRPTAEYCAQDNAMNVSAVHILSLLLYATLTATGNLVLAAAAQRLRLSQATSFSDTLMSALTNGYLWLGFGIYGFSLVFWLWLLSFIPLRYAFPIAATSIIIVPLLSGLISRDFPPTLYWVGITLVIIGLTLVVTK
jgi:drug/metabolite transporter (DMT)-like permease